MNNIVIKAISARDNFNNVKKGLHEGKRKFMDENEDSLLKQWNLYGEKLSAEICSLHELTPLWKEYSGDSNDIKDEKARKRITCFHLYGSNRPFVNEHLETLKRLNKNTEIICPICGLEVYEEVDHYIPRSEFPEFSALCLNLIPLCHSCNHDKSERWLNKAKDKRLFFNAFIDKGTEDFLDGKLEILHSYPKFRLTLKDNIDAIIRSTVTELKLMFKFQREADRVLIKEITRLETAYRNHKADYNSSADFWKPIKTDYSSYSLNHNTFSFIERMLYKNISTLPDFEKWLIPHLMTV